MGILQVRPELEPGEALRWKALANRVLRGGVTAGGQLVVTDRRLLFQPNRYDRMLGRKVWQCPLDAVTGVGTVGRDAAIFAGGLRRRLGIETTDGEQVFVVNRLGKKVAELRGLLLGAAQPRPSA
jgi:hypothetical protein